MRMVNKAIILIGLLWGLAGCQSIQNPDSPTAESFFPLSSDNNLGQAFVAEYDGLNGISLTVRSTEISTGSITLHLRNADQTEQDLRIVEVPLNAINSTGVHSFGFSPIENSNGKSYYLYLTLSGQGSVQLGATAPEKYLDGAMYINNQPGDAQLVFQLSYDPINAAFGLAGEFFTWIKFILVAVFAFTLPGYAVMRACFPKQVELSWIERIAIAGGLSLAIYPLAYLWTGVIGLHSGPFYAWVLPLTALFILLWQQRPFNIKKLSTSFKANFRRITSLENLALVFVLIALTISRFWSVRSIPVPMWGDSYQHTMIAQLLVDNNGLFQSWLPYAEMTTFTYHYGFHSLVASFYYLARLPMPLSLLWTGQIINILAVISLVLLAMRIHRSYWSASLSILLAGLLFNMPMFYTNWGRYTQLTGQVILPAVLWLAWHIFETGEESRKIYLPFWIALSGLALTHYRVLVFAIGGMAALYIVHLRKGEMIRISTKAILMSSGAFVLFLPWLINLFSGKLLTIVENNINRTTALLSSPVQMSESVGNLTTYLPTFAWIGLMIAAIWGLWKRHRGVTFILIWMILVYFSANPHLLRLPGTRLIPNFAVFIAAYMPAGILLGGFFGWLIDNFVSSAKRLGAPLFGVSIKSIFTPGIAACLVILSLLGAYRRANDLDQHTFALAAAPDLRAAEWIRKNTPPEARFLVNSFTASQYGAIVGSDGGWWLPLLANRQTTLPPLQYIAEKGPWPDYRTWINSLTEIIQSKGINSTETIDELKARGVTHIYIGQRRGRVNSPGELLPPTDLLSNPAYRPIYQQDLVWIFEIAD